MTAPSYFAPAKLNLFLAVTGRRSDGFHDLVSLVAPLDFGDTLTCETVAPDGGAAFALTCSDPAVPADESNLVMKAARAFVAATGWTGGARFELEKRIPAGAGLGGGSSDGVAALRALNALAGEPLSPARLHELAAALGSDCPLFVEPAPQVMRGRGERLEPLSPDLITALRGRRVLVFKPAFAVPTPWAYGRMAAEPAMYLPPKDAEVRLRALLDALAGGGPLAPHLFNNLERPVFAKHLALPALLERLQGEFGLAARMSGSGSACFALLPDDAPLPAITAALRDAWGDAVFVIDTRLA